VKICTAIILCVVLTILCYRCSTYSNFLFKHNSTCIKLCSSGIWHNVAWWWDTTISEESSGQKQLSLLPWRCDIMLCTLVEVH
jgi:hypothetical protein